VEEKLDGKLVHLYKETNILILEDMEYVHTIHYKSLPYSSIPFHIGLDIIQEGSILGYEKKVEICGIQGIPLPNVLISGEDISLQQIMDLTEAGSIFGDACIEGVVIKNYRKGLMGKIVNPEFDREIDEGVHWLRKPRKRNWITGN